MISVPKCAKQHWPNWLVLYDIGKNQTEQVLVCDDCFENQDINWFRLFVISKTPIDIEAGGKK
jgi:hypothetical protein